MFPAHSARLVSKRSSSRPSLSASGRGGSASASGPRAFGDQLQALDEDRQASRLVDEIDRAAGERRLFVDVVGQRCQKDHRDRDPAPAHAAQHLDAGQLRHAPIEQHRVGAAALFEIGERVAAIVEAGDLVSLIDQVEAERFAEQIVVVDEKQMRHRRSGLAPAGDDERAQAILLLGRVGGIALERVMQGAHLAAAQIEVKEQVELAGGVAVAPYRGRRRLGLFGRGPEEVGRRRLVEPDQLARPRRRRDGVGRRAAPVRGRPSPAVRSAVSEPRRRRPAASACAPGPENAGAAAAGARAAAAGGGAATGMRRRRAAGFSAQEASMTDPQAHQSRIEQPTPPLSPRHPCHDPACTRFSFAP